MIGVGVGNLKQIMNYLTYPTKCNTIASKFESVDCDKQIMNHLRFYMRRQYFFTNRAAKNELLIDELKIHVYHSCIHLVESQN